MEFADLVYASRPVGVLRYPWAVTVTRNCRSGAGV